ncbi:MAG: hypothetical protein ACTSU7_01645 [Candidatus Heimdallarchaeaceae archaeon]
MVTCVEAIIDAFKTLGGDRSFDDIENWILKKYGARWKRNTIETCMADMVPESLRGPPSSTVKPEYRILRRIDSGIYSLK